jgi:hypothetical protein
VGQQPVYGEPGNQGKGQIHGGHEGRADHIRAEQLPVGAVIRGKYPQQGFIKIVVR